jgi:hypothetical protein
MTLYVIDYISNKGDRQGICLALTAFVDRLTASN